MFVIVVCGPPGVGKTTVATRLRERLAARGHEFELLHSDAFSTDTYWRMYDRVAGTDRDWIVDGTFYRREWVEQFRTLAGDILVVRLRASLETCLERNRARDDPIEERGVHVVWREFEDPDADLTVDVDDLDAKVTVERVLAAVAGRLDDR